jgi:hypothetical protein
LITFFSAKHAHPAALGALCHRSRLAAPASYLAVDALVLICSSPFAAARPSG